MILEIAVGVGATLFVQRFAKSIKVWLRKKEQEIKETLEK
jgi:hypothetical protein